MTNRMNRMKTAAILFAVAGTVGTASAVVHPDLQLVVRSSDSVPGAAVGQTWGTGGQGAFLAPSIDDQGNVVFRATLAGTGIVTSGTSANHQGVWYGGPWNNGSGTLELTTRTSNNNLPTSPGPNNGIFTSFGNIEFAIAPNGKFQVGGTLVTGTNGITSNGNDRILWTVDGFNNATIAAQKGDLAPGTVNAKFSSAVDNIATQRINNNGQVLVSSSLISAGAGSDVTATNNFGMWVGASNSSLQLVARTGMIVPGTPAGSTLSNIGNGYVNGSGDVLFGGTLGTNAGAGINGLNSEMVLRRTGSGVSVLAREGQTFNGAPTGVTIASGTSPNPRFFPEPNMFSYAQQPFNNSGKGLFSAALAGGDAGAGTTIVEGVNDAAMIVADPVSGTSVFKQRGQQAPGLASGVNLNFTMNDASRGMINNNNQVLWASSLTGSGVTENVNDTALYLSSLGGSDNLLMRRGEQVSFMAPGVVWGDVFSPMLNNAGQIVFNTSISGDGITSANDRLLVAWDPSTGFFPILQEGDTAFGVLISDFDYNGDGNGEGGFNALSDSGWLTVAIRSAGSSNVNSAVVRIQIPAPGTGCVALLGLAALGRRRR